jgi:NADH dehydrogenase
MIDVLLLTGATGLIGSALLPRLLAAGHDVRCLVRDPRRLGAERVRVQIALGDLSDPPSFRNALRGVDTVLHLAAAIRDQPGGSIEELNGIATWRLVEAARRAGVAHFLFFSAEGVSAHSRSRFMRAKALAEGAVAASEVPHTILAPSIAYAPGDAFLTLLARMALLPVMPISGSGQARFEPIWAQDVAACTMAALARPGTGERYELSGPEVLTYDEIVEHVLRAAGRPRPLLHVPLGVVSRSLRALEALARTKAFATWDEAELMEIDMLARRGTHDAEALGIRTWALQDVLVGR